MKGACPGRIPTFPSQAGATRERASPSKTVSTGRDDPHLQEFRTGHRQPSFAMRSASAMTSSMPPCM
jgi:hypothetical protein